MILQYLPIFPLIIDNRAQEALIIVSLGLLYLQVAFYAFLFWYGYQIYRQETVNKSHSSQSSNSNSVSMLSTASLMHLRQESSMKGGDESSKEGGKHKIPSSVKMMLRLCSLYLVIHNELLVVPSTVFSLIPLICKDVHYITPESTTTISEDYYVGIQCWSGMHSFLFFCSIMHLVLLLVTKAVFMLYMNDSYFGSNLPWTQFSQRPQLFYQIIITSYALWFVFDTEKKLAVVIDTICVLGLLTVLSLRLMAPLFTSKIVKYSTLILDVSRFWITLVVVIHQILEIPFDSIELTIVIFLGIALCWVYIALLEHYLTRQLLKGPQIALQKDSAFEIYLYQLFHLLSLQQTKQEMLQTSSNVVSKKESLQALLLLSGLQQTHIQNCKETECPCSYENTVLDEELAEYGQVEENAMVTQQFDENHEEITGDNPFQKKLKLMATSKQTFKIRTKIGDLSKKERVQLIADAYIKDFEESRSFRGEQKNLKNKTSSIQNLNHNISMELSKWDAIVKYQIKKKLGVSDISITAKFRYLVSIFFFQRIKNEFQALFELMLAESSKNGVDRVQVSINQRFQLFRLLKRVEQSIVQRYESSSNSNNNNNGSLDNSYKINTMKVYEFETSFSMLQEKIMRNTQNCMKFWRHLLEKNLDASKLHKTGISISEAHLDVSRIANRLLLLYPTNVHMLLTYSRYLNDIVNNEFYAHDIFELAISQRLAFKMSKPPSENASNAEKEQVMFGDNGFCSIFILKTDFKNLGVIEYVNQEVYSMFGYKADWLVGKDISVLMPELIGTVHRQLMVKFFDKGESPIINKFRELFVKDSDGYLVPVILYPKVLPNMQNGLRFIGAIKRIPQLTYLPQQIPQDLAKLNQEYIVCDKDNYIQQISSGLSLEMGLFPRMFKGVGASSGYGGNRDIKIDDLSLDFVNREQELFEGATLNMNNKRLITKLERENISNEQFNYFMIKNSDYKVYCQLVLLNYVLTEMKLYRIVLIQRQQHGTSVSYNGSQPSGGSEPNKQVSESQREDPLINFASQSAASSSAGSMYSVDKHLKDLKLHLTENNEPPQIRAINRVLWFLVFYLLLSTSLTYYFHQSEAEAHTSHMSGALHSLELNSKFIQLQMNLRTTLDLANNVEPKLLPKEDAPYKDIDERMQSLNKLCGKLIEDVRGLNKYFEKDMGGSEQLIMVTEIDRKGYPYEYQVETKVALDQYVTKALELVFEANYNLTSLRSEAAFMTPTYDKPIPLTSPTSLMSDFSLPKSSFYILHTGFRSLLPVLDTLYHTKHSSLEQFAMNPATAWLDILSVILIILAHFMLAAVMQLVEENKVRVLALYSEVRVNDAKEALNKCQRYYSYLIQEHMMVNTKRNGAGGLDILVRIESVLLQIPKDDDDEDDDNDQFKQQWDSLNLRMIYFKQDDSQRALSNLKQAITSIEQPIVSDSLKKSSDLLHVESENKQTKRKRQPQQKKKSQIFGVKPSSLEQLEEELKEEEAQVQRLKVEYDIPTNKRREHRSDSSDNSDNDNEQEVNIADIKTNNYQVHIEEPKIGKQDQFQSIQQRNWRHIAILIIVSLMMLAYFAFSYFFHRSINLDVQDTARHLKVGLYRQKSLNLLFASLRERVILQDTLYFSTLEVQALADFYANEDQIQQQMARHSSFETFLYDMLTVLDSKQYCDNIRNNNNCSTFHRGVLEQGYKQAMFSFIKYYTQLNFTSHNRTLLLNADIQAFYLAQETYFQHSTDLILSKWLSQIIYREEWTQQIYKTGYAIFIVVFFIIEFMALPRLIKKLNETTWRSRGILTLVPNEVFKELKTNNQKLMMLFST